MLKLFPRLFVLLLASTVVLPMLVLAQGRPTVQGIRKLHQEGNYQDAFNALQQFLLEEKKPSSPLSTEEVELIGLGVSCLQSLGSLEKVDSFLESVAAAHDKNWEALRAVSKQYSEIAHQGYLQAGVFQRGWARGGQVQYANSAARDRVRSIQLQRNAISLAERNAKGKILAELYQELGERIFSVPAWKLQAKTSLDPLPDYDEGYSSGNSRDGQAAPVDPSGNPIYYSKVSSFESAKNDGERWRFSLEHAAELSPELRESMQLRFAQFLDSQFGVSSLASHYNFHTEDSEESEQQTSIYSLQTLKDDETLTRLASGIKRFRLPDEFNFISIYQTIAKSSGSLQGTALASLAKIYEDRQQYPRAAEYWKKALQTPGSASTSAWQQRLDQIVGAWGQFEATTAQVGEKPGTFDFQFRNATQVHFEAQLVRVEQLLQDTMEFLRSNPKQLDWSQMEIQNIGYRLIQEKSEKYVGQKAADWTVSLQPPPNHFSKRLTVETPLKQAGAYLLTARVAGGNTTKALLWLNDTAIVKKEIDNGHFYFVTDAKSGAPVSNLNVQFFGYRQEWNNSRSGGGSEILTKEQTIQTNASGLIFSNSKNFDKNYQWLAIVKAEGTHTRFAYLGFSGLWTTPYFDRESNKLKAYGISDRPAYRPGQTVHYKIWLRHAKYDQEKDPDISSSANLRILTPRGDTFSEVNAKLDTFGGYEGTLELPRDAQLGAYNIQIPAVGNALSFRVEEYKKPEFEVKIEAPKEPLALGEKFRATISAKYYFGAPVSKGKLHFTVKRSDTNTSWFPMGTWDWLYGSGYWWFAADYTWFPGWENWGCKAPLAWWIWQAPSHPPELVQDQEVEIGSDGTFTIEIDSQIAKDLHGDSDQKYQIAAEVTDESRRTISGSGSVLLTRRPFRVYVWTNRGYYRSGESIRADFSAQTADNKPVQGKGQVRLFALSYSEDRLPKETEIQSWPLNPDAEGSATLQMTAANSGQYRLSYQVEDEKGRSIEGGYVFTVRGPAMSDKSFRFNALELTPAKREYAPGETLELQISTEQNNATVLFFLRAANGITLAPEVLQLKGKSMLKSIDISMKDMPNFFIEALTVHNGQVYTQIKEIVVPPEQRVLTVEIEPSSKKFRPGEKGEFSLRVTDQAGKAVSGSVVLTAYDKSLEYISGGSNVPEIKAFFWKWRRTHRSAFESNLMKSFPRIFIPGTASMLPLGLFGGSEMDFEDSTPSGAAFPRQRPVGKSEAKMQANLTGSSAGAMSFAPASAPLARDAGRGAEEGFSADTQSDNDSSAESEIVPGSTPQVRSAFADTAYWNGNVELDEEGKASLSFPLPENLTTWKLRAWALSDGTRVGEGSAEVLTSKDLLLRLQAPRFLIEKDEVVLSANIHNYLPQRKRITARIEVSEDHLTLLDQKEKVIEIPSQGEVRIDWRAKAMSEGEAIIRMSAQSGKDSDGMEMKIPVHVHGILKTQSFSRALKPTAEKEEIRFTVPADRKVEQSRLELRYSPTLAGAMVDALPYLVNYPYGCTEQTLSRFLPTVITQKVLKQMGISLSSIAEKRSNLNAQEIGDDKSRAEGWKRYEVNPVFDEKTVTEMAKSGLEKLVDMQLSNGGWGWFSGWGETASAHLSAHVLHGLQVAQKLGLNVPSQSLSKGIEYLKSYEAEELQKLKNAATKTAPYKEHANELDAYVHMVLVDADAGEPSMRDFLYRDRNQMAVSAKALLGLLFHTLGDKEKVLMIRQNIEQYLVKDAENQTAYLRLGNEGYWWYWYGSEYEAHAYYLKLLVNIDPRDEIAPMLVKYLLNNRKNATYWNSTRDTALIIEAFADYLTSSQEMSPQMKVTLVLDGKILKEVEMNPENLFSFDNKLVLEGTEVTSGEHRLEIRKDGRGPLYLNLYLTNFTKEDPITRAGLEIKVDRKYYKLVRDEEAEALVRGSHGQALQQRVEKYKREALTSPITLNSGDLIEVELEVESKNDYEYLLFEDYKAAGFEPLEVKSGYNGNALGAYVEFRDDRVAFFSRTLPRGKRSVSYRLRAETPGSFSALPTKASAMYAPELRANSDESKAGITDKE